MTISEKGFCQVVLQIVFSDNLNPAIANLSDRFTNATAFYISAPLIDSELEIDVFLQIYFPALIGEQVRNIPLGKISEAAVLLNIADTESVTAIPNEYLDTGLEMALLFLPSSDTFLQAAVIKPNCTLNTVCNDLAAIDSRLARIESALNIPIPVTPATASASSGSQLKFLGVI